VTPRWSNAARQDLARIFDLNADYDPARARLIDRRPIDEVARCADRPLTGRPIAGTAVRERPVTDIQYLIRYRVEDDSVTVLGIRHTRENRGTP